MIKEITGRPAASAKARTVSAIRAVVHLAYGVKSFNATPCVHKKHFAPFCL
jgi:hypothetical protein